MQIAKILDCSQEAVQDTQNLQRNLKSLREEKEYWENFMDLEEWNRETVDEVEIAWNKRYSPLPSLFLITVTFVILFIAIRHEWRGQNCFDTSINTITKREYNLQSIRVECFDENIIYLGNWRSQK